MLDSVLSFDWRMVLTVVMVVVALYVVICAIVGFTKGWVSVGRIWFWTKKLWWLGLIIVGLILISKTLRNKNKRKEEISGRIEEIRLIETKTESDRRELVRLENDKKKIEQEVVEITRKYEEKVKKLKERPPEEDQKPGGAERSHSDLTNNW